MKAAFRRLIAALFERQVRRLIRRHRLKVVAVGGSVGKTTTRAAIATMLATKYRIQEIPNPGYNSEIGLPLSVFEMTVPGFLLNPFAWIMLLIRTELIIWRTYHGQALVLELGTDHPGEIARYLEYLHPDVGVITAVTPEHMENFPGLDAVAAEELALGAGSKQVVANHDEIAQTYRHRYLDHHPHHQYYGLGKAEYLATGFEISSLDPLGGITGDLSSRGHIIQKDLHLDLYSAHTVKSAPAAFAVGELMGLNARQLADGLSNIRPVSGRMNPLKGINGSIIIDDTYNSSPEAALAALKTLADAPVTGRRIAILGSMNELGPKSPEYHRTVGTAAADLDLLVTIGELANEHLGPAATTAGLDPSRYRSADSPLSAANYLKLVLRPGDVVLAKGSQNGVFAEEAVKPLLASAADATHLVRQSPSWLRAKARQFPDLTAKSDD